MNVVGGLIIIKMNLIIIGIIYIILSIFFIRRFSRQHIFVGEDTYEYTFMSIFFGIIFPIIIIYISILNLLKREKNEK